MYTTQPGAVVALDARTGRQIWKYTRAQKVLNPNEINPFNRGVAISGQRLFVGTLDAALVAIDARTGAPLWETQVADTMLGYSLTSAPLVVKDKVIVGITGGEFGARGFLDAYDAATESGCGAGMPSRGPASSATTRGRAKAGNAAAARCGSPARTIRISITSTGRSAIPVPKSIARCAVISTISSATRSSRSIRTRVSANGTTSSRRTTATIGTRARTSCSWTACGAARCANCCCTRTATASSTCSIAPPANSCPARRSCT